jgi:aryl hydrocarbon receptor nuclear translocator
LQVTSTPNSGDLAGSNAEFVSRHDPDSRITFLDHRVRTLLGYETKELLGKVAFDFYHPEDLPHMKDSFDQGLS